MSWFLDIFWEILYPQDFCPRFGETKLNKKLSVRMVTVALSQTVAYVPSKSPSLLGCEEGQGTVKFDDVGDLRTTITRHPGYIPAVTRVIELTRPLIFGDHQWQ